jgi:hypothetical protein
LTPALHERELLGGFFVVLGFNQRGYGDSQSRCHVGLRHSVLLLLSARLFTFGSRR